MSRYTHEGPMDFEFQNGTGPIDARSPFAQISQNAQRLPAKRETSQQDVYMWNSDELIRGCPGTYSAFDSPSKAQPSHQSSPNKPLPAAPLPAYHHLFTTPRKAAADWDDSSAGETPRSPENKDDSDATPEIKNVRAAMTIFDNLSRPTSRAAEKKSSPTKEKTKSPTKDSLLEKFKKSIKPSGRGEIPRTDHVGPLETRIEKRRKREVDRKFGRKRRRSMTDSEADNEHQPSPRKQLDGTLDSTPKQHWLSSMFTFIAQHPTVPHILSFYAQLAFNLFLLGGCAYLIYCFWSAVQGDVDKKSHEAMADIMAEMAACAEQFTQNRCDRSTRVPAMETVCENWSKCMNRDPAMVGRAKVSAHTFAEIFNSFVEPISYKAMIFTFILVFGCFAISNFAFGFFRDKAANAPGFQHYYPPPPPTPQRNFSGPDGQFYGGTPWHQPQTGFSPQPSAAYGQIEGRTSPVRRLMYN